VHQSVNTMTFALALLAGCATPTAPVIPDKLAAGANETLTMVVPAKGVQIYECRARDDQPGAYQWAFVAPEADLYDQRGKRIGRHYGGPHWESNDGSKIVGALKERTDAPMPGAIPWLLLTAKSVGPQGAFSRVTSIQRVNTVGGVAPATGCSSANAGVIARMHYTTDYHFFSDR
jgi:hypothetical protein